MGKPEIVGLTISVSLADKSYGSGSESFLSLQGRYPDPTVLTEVLTDGLEMYFTAWESLLASRYATGAMQGVDFKKQIEDAKARLVKVRTFLKEKNVE